jgi:hypothetical protein
MLIHEADHSLLPFSVLQLIHCEYNYFPSIFYVLMQGVW